MSLQLPTLIATSVVRGSQQGESHGGVYTLDFENQKAEQRLTGTPVPSILTAVVQTVVCEALALIMKNTYCCF